jgi:hypothetical protein
MSIRDHNKGQTDRSNGKYEPPIGVVEEFFTWSPSGMKDVSERNGDYKDGWSNTDNQKS